MALTEKGLNVNESSSTRGIAPGKNANTFSKAQRWQETHD
jgi:hypothetical protein